MPKHEPIMQKCDVCGGMYQHGPGTYGQKLHLYGGGCCRTCWATNSDGWAPAYEKKLLALLKKNGLPIPARNANGLLPRN